MFTFRRTAELAFTFAMASLWLGGSIENRAAAQQVRPLPVEDALKVHYFAEYSPISFSPDGKWLAYAIRDNQRSKDIDTETYARTGVEGIGIGADVCISNIETTETRCLTGGQGDNWLPAWSPDGRYLAFLSDRDGSGQARVWVWDATTNELRKVSEINVRSAGKEIQWMPDSHKLLVTTLPQGLSPETFAKRLSSGVESEYGAGANGIHESTVIVYEGGVEIQEDHKRGRSDPLNLDIWLGDLSSVDVATGRDRRIVTGESIASYLLSPDGTRIAYTVPRRFESPSSQQILFDLATVKLSDQKKSVLASDIRLDYGGVAFSWSPDGSQLSFHVGGQLVTNSDCYVVDANGGVPRNVTGLPAGRSRTRKSPPLWDAGGKNIYCLNEGALWRAAVDQGKAQKIGEVPERRITGLIAQSVNQVWTVDNAKSIVVVARDDLAKRDGFYKLAVESGERAKLLEKNQCYSCATVRQKFSITKDRQHIAFFVEDAQHDSDLWTSDSTFRSPERLTHRNPQFDRYKMGAARLVDWLSDDGERLWGALLLPSDYQEGNRYPLIVWVYGGNSQSDALDRFGFEGFAPINLQLLATRGYAVLLPDAPQHLGTPMLDLAKTVLPGVNKLIDMGIVNPDRLGVIGHSYGGYSALSLIVQTKRFKAAVVADGIGDWIAAYGQMSSDGTAFEVAAAEGGQGLIGGPPWEIPNRYIENSPFFYLNRVETPLLIVHGAEDRSVAPFLGDEIFVGLRRLGKQVTYAKYAGEGHSPADWSHANQMDFCNRMLRWFDNYLKPQ